MKSLIVALLGLLSVIYILNPGAGIFDLIPDIIPFVGNLDEAAATALFISCLGYFGIDLANIFKKDKSAFNHDEISKKDNS
ncbi:MAG: DUF1232 domain-containing protein [Pseudomonadota bacterium]